MMESRQVGLSSWTLTPVSMVRIHPLQPLKGIMGEFIKKFPKEKFLVLIGQGLLEDEALKEVDMPKGTFIQLQLKDPEFKDALDAAKKERADVWFSDIAKSVRKDLTKEEVAAEKLKFEQRKYLASIDNPDKYAEKSKKEIDLNINIFQEMKELPVAEARKMLASMDPFNIVEAEFSAGEIVQGIGSEGGELRAGEINGADGLEDLLS